MRFAVRRFVLAAALATMTSAACAHAPPEPPIGVSLKATHGEGPALDPTRAASESASFEERLAAAWTRPWPTRRGAEGEDCDVTLARAPVEDVARALARGGAWDRDVVGKTVTVARSFAFVVRLRGHAWTIVLAEDLPIGPDLLSREMRAPVATLTEYEGSIEYSYYEGGARTEHLLARGGAIESIESPRLGALDLAKVRPGDLADTLMKSIDAYAPLLQSTYFFGDGETTPDIGVGDRRVVGNRGLVLSMGRRRLVSVPDIERVDYVAW
jgi:hypothetical protein